MSNSVVSVAKAARLVKKHKQTLYNHNEAGKLSFVRRDDDSMGVEIVELQRVYGKLHVNASEMPVVKTSPEIDRIKNEFDKQAIELKHVKEANVRQEETVEFLRGEVAKATESKKLLEHDKRQREQEWRAVLSERQEEIRQARVEADEIRQREVDQAKELHMEKARVAALESRGFWARLTNKKIELA